VPTEDMRAAYATGTLSVEAAYDQVCQDLGEAANWYMNKKRSKRAAARALRIASITLAVLGAVVPFLSGIWGVPLGYGYILLVLAGGLQFLDRAFGLSEAWMRQVAAGLELMATLRELQLDYAHYSDGDGEIDQKWSMIRQYSARGWRIVARETTDWASTLRLVAGELPSDAGKRPSPVSFE